MLSFPNWGRANYEPILCIDYVCADLEFMTVLMSVDHAIIYTGEMYSSFFGEKHIGIGNSCAVCAPSP